MLELLEKKYIEIQDLNISLCSKSTTITNEMIVNRTILVKLKQLIEQIKQ